MKGKELEAALIGSIINGGEEYFREAVRIIPDDFEWKSCFWTYRAIEECYKKAEDINYHNIFKWLKSHRDYSNYEYPSWYNKFSKYKFGLGDIPEIVEALINNGDLPFEGTVLYFENEAAKATKRICFKDNSEETSIPDYYGWLKNACGVEPIEILKHFNFCRANALKYIIRAGRKKEEGVSDREKEIQDLEKAQWYITREIKRLKDEE